VRDRQSAHEQRAATGEFPVGRGHGAAPRGCPARAAAPLAGRVAIAGVGARGATASDARARTSLPVPPSRLASPPGRKATRLGGRETGTRRAGPHC